MDINTVKDVVEGGILLLGAGALVLTQHQVSCLRHDVGKLITSDLEDLKSSVMETLARVDDLDVALDGAAEALRSTQDHVGITPPDVLARQAKTERLRQAFREIGMAVDSQELTEEQLRDLEAALHLLQAAPVRRESDEEVNEDLARLTGDATADHQ